MLPRHCVCLVAFEILAMDIVVFTACVLQEMYLKTLKNKLLSFKQRQPTIEATPVSPVVLAAGDNESPQVKPPPATDVSMVEMDMAPFLEQLPVSLPQAEMDPAVAKLHQQYQQQRVEMIKNQQSETQKCCQAQMMQQSQMTTAHIQQNMPMVGPIAFLFAC
ncbi:hypothetical protein AC1031_016831 [Aphanomyces cochlioides]|nr:hypothetical protein AC1031_016831 [Aphanomyces cochlioides]